MIDPSAAVSALAAEPGAAAQVLAVLLSALGVYRSVRRLRREVRAFRVELERLGWHVQDHDLAAAGGAEAPDAHERIRARVGNLRAWRTARGAGGAALLLALGLALLPGEARALSQVGFTPAGAQSIDPTPYLLYRSTTTAYGLRARCTSGAGGYGGFTPVELEVTDQRGVASTLVIFDDSVYTFESRKIRVVKVNGFAADDSSAVYFFEIFQSPGEVALVSPAPPPPDKGAPDPLRDDSSILMAASDATTTCESAGVVNPLVAVYREGRSAKIATDSQVRTAAVIARYVTLQWTGRNNLDNADANFTGGSFVAYYRTDASVTGKWYRRPELDRTALVASPTHAYELTLNTVGYYCFIPSGITGASKVRLVRRYSFEPLPR